MSKPTAQVVAALSQCSRPAALLQLGPQPKLLQQGSQLRIKNGRYTFVLDCWAIEAADDPFLAEIKAILLPLNVDVHVANTPFVNILGNCNVQTAVYVEDDSHIQECTEGEDALHDRQIEAVQALLNPNRPRVVIISEPYGFGKTRLSAVAACCRFPNQLIVMIVDMPLLAFAASEARRTTARVVEFTGTAKSNECARDVSGTVLVVVKRNMVDRLAAVLRRRAALIIVDEAYRNKDTEPNYISNAQKIANGHTHWWVTDAFVTARSAGRINDASRRNWLWQQINRFRIIAGLWALPQYCPRKLVQDHVVQHSDEIMSELAGKRDGWSLFQGSGANGYCINDTFTAAKAGRLIRNIHGFFKTKPGLARKAVIMGSFSNKIYVEGTERKNLIRAFRANANVTVFEQACVTTRVNKFNDAKPKPGHLAFMFVSGKTMKQVTLKADLMVCLGDAELLTDSFHSFRDGVTRRRERLAVLESTEGRIRRCEPGADKKYYRYFYQVKDSPQPKSKRRKVE